MNWKQVKLGELLTESRIPSDNPDPDKRIKVKLKVLGVEKRGLENEIEGATKQFVRKAGQFIYGKQNFHKGAFGIVPDELDGFESSADLPAFDVASDCLPEWIFYFFKQGNYYLELGKIARGVATQRIHPEQIYNIEIPLPSLEVQKEILEKIKSHENTGCEIENELTNQLTLVKKLRQQLLQDAVQGKLLKQDPNDEPASELLKRIKAEKAKLVAEKKIKKEKELPPIKPEEIPFEIPEGWVWCRLGEISEFISGTNFSSSDFTKGNGAKCIKITNAGVGELIETEDVLPAEFVDKFKSYLVFEGDLILALTRPYIADGLKISKCPESYNASLLNQRVAVIRPNEQVHKEYIYQFLRSDYVLNIYKTKFEGKGQQPNLKKENVTELLIPLPSLAEQNRILLMLDELNHYFNNLEASIKESEVQNERLLQQVLKEALRSNQ